jgi:hypothetical protein
MAAVLLMVRLARPSVARALDDAQAAGAPPVTVEPVPVTSKR